MIFAAAMLAAFGMSTVAQATLLDFKITGDYTVSFQLDSNPTPDDESSNQGFIIWDVPGFSVTANGLADVTFFSAVVGGGFQIDDFYGASTLLVTDGPQLYTGPESAPIFKQGNFSLTQYQGNGSYTLTISEAVADPNPAPEPITLALFGAGLAGLAATRRRRKA